LKAPEERLAESKSTWVAERKELATALGITGTPGFVIGDQLIPGAISIEKLKQAIAEARRAG